MLRSQKKKKKKCTVMTFTSFFILLFAHEDVTSKCDLL